MSSENFVPIPGVMADEDLSAHQYHAVRLSAAFKVSTITNGNGQRAIGILQDDPDADGKPALVAASGVCRAEAGGTISAGDTLAYNNDGELIQDAENTSGGTVDLWHIADALEAGVDGDIIWVLAHTPILVGTE